MMLFSFLDFFLEMKACFNFAFRKTWPFCFLHNWGDPGYLSGFSSAGASISVELLPPSTDTTRCSVILLKCHNWVWTPTFLRQFPVADFRKQSFNHGLVSRMIKWAVETAIVQQNKNAHDRLPTHRPDSKFMSAKGYQDLFAFTHFVQHSRFKFLILTYH